MIDGQRAGVGAMRSTLSSTTRSSRATSSRTKAASATSARAALALGPHITALDSAELTANAAENFDADRPWQNYNARLPGGR